MKILTLLSFLLLSLSSNGQILRFETTIDYYLKDQECLYPIDTFKRNGLSEKSMVYAELIKNDKLYSRTHECGGLQEIIIGNLIQGNIKAFDLQSDKLLDNKEVLKYLYRSAYDVCSGQSFSILKVDEIRLFRINQEWKILDNSKIQSKITSITLIEVDEKQVQKPLLKVKFNNQFESKSIINEEANIYISLIMERVSKDDLDINNYVSTYFNSSKVPKHDCKYNGIFGDCEQIENAKLIKKNIEDCDGFTLYQYFYFNQEDYSINSQFVSISTMKALYENGGNFKYFDSNLWINIPRDH